MNKKIYIQRITHLSFMAGAVLMGASNTTQAQMDVPHYGLSTMVKASNNPAWQNVVNVCFPDSQYAYVTLKPGVASDTMEVENFHFNIPADANIEGVTVTISKKAMGAGIIDNMVKLTYNGSICGANHAGIQEWPLQDTSYLYGGNYDTWKVKLTPAIVNSYSFGVAFCASNSIYGADSYNTADVDYINVSVKYTVNDNTIAFCRNVTTNKKLKYYHRRRY